MPLVVDAGELANGVHSEHGVADIDGFDAAEGFGDGANGGAATHVRTVGEGLVRNALACAEGAEDGFTAWSGGVAVVGSKLEYRATA